MSGTAGAFCTALALIPQLGNNMAFIITLICFLICSITWFFITDLGFQRQTGLVLKSQPGYVRAILGGFYLFAGVHLGGRQNTLLLPQVPLADPQLRHRPLRAPLPGERHRAAGGPPLPRRLGLVADHGRRAVRPALHPPRPHAHAVGSASTPDAARRLVHPLLAASPRRRRAGVDRRRHLPYPSRSAGPPATSRSQLYIQACLARLESDNTEVSAARRRYGPFLYSFYIELYAVLGTVLGRYLDGVYKLDWRREGRQQSRRGWCIPGPCKFAVICVLVFASRDPRAQGARLPSTRPMLSDEKLDVDLGGEEELPITPGAMAAKEKDGREEGKDAQQS
ncbi:hypothetical protein VTK56DRAFT_4833 [Thermocarpiscus australiensis]